MKKLSKYGVCLLLLISCTMYPFAYDKGILSGQKGEWKEAHETLNIVLADTPDRADVLYDAGVAAQNLGKITQAVACFLRAAEFSDDSALKAQAHFNAGNMLVAQNKLKDALDQYQHVLTIDSTHEYANHNYERVKKMLEDQKQKEQQEQQKKNQQQQKNQQQNQQNQQQNQQQQDQEKNQQERNENQGSGQKQQQQEKNQQEQDQQQQERDKQQQQDDTQEQDKKQNDQKNDQRNSNSSSQQQNSQQDSSKDELNKKPEHDQADKTESGSKDTQRKNHRDNDAHKQQSSQKKQRQGNQQSEEKSHDTDNKGDIKNRDQHTHAPTEKTEGSHGASVSSGAGSEQGKIADEIQKWAQENPWMVEILKAQEERDKITNKQLMEAKIHQHGGKNGQNCW